MKKSIILLLSLFTIMMLLASCGASAGPAGADGKDGATPNIGSNGNWWINGVDTGIMATGPKGDIGPIGPNGEKGEKGDKGDKGDTGAQGIQGEKGDKGDTGAQGIQGEKGDKGDPGKQGESGISGNDGMPGVGVEKIYIDESTLHLIVIYTDGTVIDAGYVGVNNESSQIVFHTVTYMHNGSVIGMQHVIDGTTTMEPQAPEMYGYFFDGWYADKDFTTEFNFLGAIKENTTVYAKYLLSEVPEDINTAKGMNLALSEYAAKNGTPENFDEVLEAIEAYNYTLSDFIPKAEGNLYGWDAKNNQIVYIDAEGEPIYKNTEFAKADVKFIVNGNVPAPEGFADPVDMSKPEGPKAFKAALEDGISVTLTKDMTITSTVNVSSAVTITLGDNKLDASANTSRPFKLYKGASVVIEAGNSEVVCGNYGFVEVNEGASVTINGGKFTADTDEGAFIKVGSAGATIVLNNVNYTDAYTGSRGGVVINGNGYNGNVTVNGGNFNTNTGFVVTGTATFNGATITTKGYAINASGTAGKTTITNCTITTGTQVVGQGVPAYAVVASSGAEMEVKDSVITSAVYELGVLNTGGKVAATNCKTGTGAALSKFDAMALNGAKVDYSFITVDGTVVAGEKK